MFTFNIAIYNQGNWLCIWYQNPKKAKSLAFFHTGGEHLDTRLWAHQKLTLIRVTEMGRRARKWGHHFLSVVPALCKKKKVSGARIFLAPCLVTVGMMSPTASGSCGLDFPNMLGLSCELKYTRSPADFVWYFSKPEEKKPRQRYRINCYDNLSLFFNSLVFFFSSILRRN